MTQTTNTPEGSETSGAHKQVGQPVAIVATQRARDYSRRQAAVARRRLDVQLGVADFPHVEIDYAACGLTLGWPERVAAGLALRERAA